MSTRFAGTKIARHAPKRMMAAHIVGMTVHATARGTRAADLFAPHDGHRHAFFEEAEEEE